MILIDGYLAANEIYSMLREKIKNLRTRGITPSLATILVGDDNASKIYVSKKIEAAEDLGINVYLETFGSSITQRALDAKIEHFNNHKSCHGILLQLPLPAHFDSRALLDRIDWRKDIDGFSRRNMGSLATKCTDALYPCTPLAVMQLLDRTYPDGISGKKVLIIGRSIVVGQPLSMMLTHRDATVTIAHSKTVGLCEYMLESDIVISAAGCRELVEADTIKKGACIIDVGIHRIEGKVFGDVDIDQLKDKAGYATPTPGGVGPVTVACLMSNVIRAVCLQKKIEYNTI